MSQTQAQKVHLSIVLCIDPPATLSLSPANSTHIIRLVATIHQTASPYPDRPITLLTNYSALDTNPDGDAFSYQRMRSPVSLNDPNKDIKMYPHESRVNRIRPNGDLDMRMRDDFRFITVPSMESGETVSVIWELSTASMLRFSSAPLVEKLARFQRGERFRIGMNALWVNWWAYGDLEGDLREKKFSRWMFPEGRAEGDLGEHVAKALRDPITGHNVNSLGSRACVEGEGRPDLEKMVREGWVLGEANEGLEGTCRNGDEGVVFEFVE